MKRMDWREFVNRKSDKKFKRYFRITKKSSDGYQTTKSSNLCYRTDRMPYPSISSLQ
jgi:hypothetical protein